MTADGNVNFDDLAAFAPIFNAAAAGGAAQAVPEPASSVLVLIGLAAALAFVRRKR
jgi:hypothetical protein